MFLMVQNIFILWSSHSILCQHYIKTMFTGKLVLKMLTLGVSEDLMNFWIVYCIWHIVNTHCIRFFKLCIYTWCILVCEYLCMGSIIYLGHYSSEKMMLPAKTLSTFIFAFLTPFSSMPFFFSVCVQKTLIWKLRKS